MNFIRPWLWQLTPYSSEHYDHIQDKLDANEVALDLPLELKQKLATELTDRLWTNRYPDESYCNLRAQIAHYVGVSKDWISIGNGSDELIRSVLLALEGGILVAPPTFSMYSILANTLGIPVYNVPRSELDFTIDLDQAQKTIEAENIKAVFVVHPNSPTGNLLTEPEIEWLRSLSADILVVIDEAYYEFSGCSLVGELSNHPNWLILRTFSKALRLAAFRLGYAIASPELISVLEKIRLPYNLPTMSAVAGELVLKYAKEILAIIPEIRQERQKLWHFFQSLPPIKVWQSEANFIYCRSPHDRLLQQYLAKQGTLIRQTGGGLRITIGTPEQNQRTMDRVTNFYKH